MTDSLYSLRVAAAPISWGVCEVPGWGHVLDAHTVLSEMRRLGITAAELGPPGYLPAAAARLRELLSTYDIAPIGGFLALPLHANPQDAMAIASRTCELFADIGAEILVLAAATGARGYDTRPSLDDSQWRTLVATADAIGELAAGHGLRAVLHPHIGTHVESRAEVERFLADSGLGICLDTGHLMVGGTDPVALARHSGHRIGHIHLKDVRAGLAEEIRCGGREYSRAVHEGLFTPLGEGDVDIAALIETVHAAGYRGWYVLEQDTALAEGDSGVDASRDTARSLRYLESVGAALGAEPQSNPVRRTA